MNVEKINRTIDLDEDIIQKISSIYNEAYTTFMESKVVTDGYVTAVFSSYKNIIDKNNNDISQLLYDAGIEIADVLTKIENIDNSIKEVFDADSYSFNDVMSILSAVPCGEKLKIADKEFFESCPDAKVVEYKDDDGKMQFQVIWNGFVYNSETSKLTDSNGLDVEVKYYVPNNISSLEELNTFTTLSGDLLFDEHSFDGIMGNSLVVVPNESYASENGNFNSIYNSIKSSISFAKSIIKQKNGCSNIIAGGCLAMKIAAKSHLYDTVICVNNAALVDGVNANMGTKAQFNSLKDLKKLDGKNIYFISTKNDPNLYHCATDTNSWEECSDISKSYLYTGIELTVKTCPNSVVYLITNSEYKGFNNIAKENKNFVYSTKLWEILFSNKKNSTPNDYKEIISDLINNGFTGYNMYMNISS